MTMAHREALLHLWGARFPIAHLINEQRARQRLRKAKAQETHYQRNADRVSDGQLIKHDCATLVRRTQKLRRKGKTINAASANADMGKKER